MVGMVVYREVLVGRNERERLTRRLSRVALFGKRANKGCLRRFIASLLIYSQFIQLSAAAVLPNSSPQNPLSSVSQQGKPITRSTPVSAGPFTPLVNYAQTGTLNNLSLTNRQLNFSGPLNWGVTYSDLTGTYFNSQYVLPLGEQLALGALGEYGSGQYRINGTLGYGLSPLAQVKFTAERFGQRLPFQFDSGDIESRVHQDAYGVRFQQLFNVPFLQGFNLGGYYANANSKDLNPLVFTSNGSHCGGFACINYRHLAGATSTGADAGIDVLLTPSTLVSGNLYYDRVYYNPIFSHTSNEDRNGLGGGVRLNQLLGERFKLTGEATVREIYDTYQADLSWLPNIQRAKLGIELSLFGQHVTSHNATPDNNSVGLQVNFLEGGNKRYDERHQWGRQRLSDIAQWVSAPAVKMNQVLVIAEQVTKRLAPGIMSIIPSSGPFAGGNIIMITGSNFLQGLLVFFGGQLATNIQVLSPTSIMVVVPAAVTSFAASDTVINIVIQNPDGQQVSFSEGYTYINNVTPTVSTINPASGPLSGSTGVVLSGTGFGTTSDTVVVFNGTNITPTAVSSTSITFNVPATATAGTVDVSVTTPGGNSGTVVGGYTYYAVPTVSTINPASGPLSGSTGVVLSGTGFGTTSDTVVVFNGMNITPTAVSSTSITFNLPATATAGTVDVSVTTPGGNSGTVVGGYTYDVAPTVSTISPASGPLSGSTGVVLLGTGFGTTSDTVVVFNGTNITPTAVSSTSITFNVPATATAGTVNVSVTTPGGNSGTVVGGYTYYAVPTVSTINPAGGPLSGSTGVVLSGTGFGTTSDTVVVFNGTNITPTAVSSTSVTFNVPSTATAGTVNVSVTTPGGNSGTVVGGYTYYAAPTASAINPAGGPLSGSTGVVLSGTGFGTTSNTVVVFNGTNITPTAVSSTSITFNVPATATAATVNVSVTTPGGSSGNVVGGYTYQTPDSITGVTANGTTFPIGTYSGFPQTGFNKATFTINLASGAPSNYTWSSDASWVSVSSAGVVTFNSPSKPSSGAATITATRIPGGTVLTYSFTLANWFVNNGLQNRSQSACASYCAGLSGGYSLAPVNLLTTAAVGSATYATQSIGNLLGEWGGIVTPGTSAGMRSTTYPGSGWSSSSYWTSTIDPGNNKPIYTDLGVGYVSIGYNGSTTAYVVCASAF